MVVRPKGWLMDYTPFQPRQGFSTRRWQPVIQQASGLRYDDQGLTIPADCLGLGVWDFATPELGLVIFSHFATSTETPAPLLCRWRYQLH